MLVIKNVLLVDAKRKVQADLAINKGKIASIGKDLKGERSIDAEGKVVMPAFIDSHAHFREPGFEYKEDIETGSRAALKGGYATVCLMANTSPVVDSAATYDYVMKRAKEVGLINIIQCFAVTKDLAGEDYTDLDALPESVRFISDDGHGLYSNAGTYQLFERLAGRDLTIMIHEEDKGLSKIDYRLAEDVHTLRDVYLAGKTGARVHFSHVSTIDAARAIRQGKGLGYDISMEVTPHHIYMVDSDYRVHPPIRREKDRDYLVKCLIDGTADCIGTDHAPHSQEDKEAGSPGMIGLETAFQIVYKVLAQEYGQDLQLISQVMSAGPAKVLGLESKGYLEVGYDADLVILDLKAQQTIREENIVSKSKNTPFIGQTFTGQVDKTLVAGQVKYDRGGMSYDNR